MNYTILILGALLIAMALSCFVEGRNSYSPPLDTDYASTTTRTVVIEGNAFPVSVAEEEVVAGVQDAKGVRSKEVKQSV
jgi:hypothetical protein